MLKYGQRIKTSLSEWVSLHWKDRKADKLRIAHQKISDYMVQILIRKTYSSSNYPIQDGMEQPRSHKTTSDSKIRRTSSKRKTGTANNLYSQIYQTRRSQFSVSLYLERPECRKTR